MATWETTPPPKSSDWDETARAASSEGQVDVNVVLDVGRASDALADAAAIGFECVDYLDLLGIAHGRIAANKVDELRALPGITSVERDQDEHTWTRRAV